MAPLLFKGGGLWAPVAMSNQSPEPDDIQDQDAEPSLNAPEEGRPDGVQPDNADDEGSEDADD